MKSIQIIFFLIFGAFTFAINPELHVKYLYTTVRDANISSDSIFADLWLNKNESYFLVNNKRYIPGTLYIDEDKQTRGSLKDNQYEVFKNFNENKMYSQALIKYQYDAILAQNLDEVQAINIKKAKRKILGYNCSEATIRFNGRSYIVYFTNEISFQNGPWKMHGLPGLILEVKETSGLMHIKALSVKHLKPNTVKISPSINVEKALTWNAIMILAKRTYRRIQKMMQECCENKPVIKTHNSLEVYDLNTPETYSLRYNVYAELETKKRKSKTLTTEFHLKTDESQSTFEYVEKVLNVQGMQRFSIKDQEGVKYKNTIDSSFTHNRTLSGKKFLISDQLKTIPWVILNDSQKVIGNFNARKAIARSGSYYLEAWFTDELPINNGPGEYWGLPGLILELKEQYQSSSGSIETTYFNLKSIEKESEEIALRNMEGEVMTKESFLKMEEDLFNKRMEMMSGAVDTSE